MRLGISRPVRLLQSWAVQVPVMLGWFKPVILLPVSTLTGLSPGQVESILAHELAHVRRHDYLVNLLQSALETLLFYHPAVWWVSQCTREERENCCDDLAVQVCGDARQYAQALATLEELRSQPVTLALGAHGKPLLKRIRRLLGQRGEAKQNLMARNVGGALAMLLVSGLFIALPMAYSQKHESASELQRKQYPPSSPSTNRPKAGNTVGTSSAASTNLALYTRAFKVDPNIFESKLLELANETNKNYTNHSFRSRSGYGGRRGANTNTPAIDQRKEVVRVLQALQDCAKAIGVDTSAEGRQLFYKPPRGMLMVRATLQELDKIEKFVQVLNQVPRQVTLACKIVQIDEEPGKPFRLEDVLGQGKFYTSTNLVKLPPTNAPGQTSRATTRPPTNTTVSASILTDPQFRTVLAALDTFPGAEVLTTPKVTTLSSRQAQVQVIDVQYHATNKDDNLNPPPPKVNAGPRSNFGGEEKRLPVLDMVPYVSADGYTIQMTVIPTLHEFAGYDLGGDPFQASRYAKGPIPIYRKWQVVASAVVWDGQTLVLDGLVSENLNKTKDKVPVLGDLPLIGRLYRSESFQTKKKNLLVFVTPTIIDPAGNRVHSEEEMPFAQAAVPPQLHER